MYPWPIWGQHIVYKYFLNGFKHARQFVCQSKRQKTLTHSFFTCGTKKHVKQETHPDMHWRGASQMRSGYCCFFFTGSKHRKNVQAAGQHKKHPHLCVDRAGQGSNWEDRDSKEWLTDTFRVVFMCGWGHYPKRLGKPQHSTPGLKETERRCHHEYLGSKVLTYGEGYLRRHRSQ